MNDSDSIKMEINIAGERIFLTVPVSMQKAVRSTEHHVSDLYRQWRRDFPQKSDKELLAMMAYQYASYYDQLLHRQEESRLKAEDINSRLDALIDADAPAPES